MPASVSPLNLIGAAAICASLALLGWEIDTRSRVETRFLSVTVQGAHESQDDEDVVPAPDEERRQGGLDDRNWYPNGPHRDGDDFYDGPADDPGPDGAIPT